ncbi:MAG: hypothetical protein LBT51_08075 [Fusobacteriaceae bacterium]|jgi:hypothetical protein|nr:hypothetical protein [Fusobacteriaceae bacterium]
MININEKIEIPLSKKKLFLLLLSSIGLIGSSVWIIFIRGLNIVQNPINNSYEIIDFDIFYIIVGLIGIIFFGICDVFVIKSLLKKEMGLVIDCYGITDNTSGISIGHIPWENIIEINRMNISKQKMVIIIVSNPKEYINRQTNPISRKAAEANYRMYGSPIFISSNTLKCDFIKLNTVLHEEFEKYKNNINY